MTKYYILYGVARFFFLFQCVCLYEPIVSLNFSLIDYCCLVFNDPTNEMNTELLSINYCHVHISPYRR